VNLTLTHGAEPFLRSCQFELPSVLWNPNVHYGVHKRPPPVPIPSQIDPIPTIPSYLSKIHFNIVHPPTSWSSQWSLSFWISHLYPICSPLLPQSCYMPCPSHHPGDLYLFNFTIAISTSKGLGSGTNGSAVCISICLTSLTLCTFQLGGWAWG
jgi:hypothetical protein